ncbi:MAG TPA: septation protein A [Rhizomicrobium sp.]|jgi:intracellular septation protein|nr:septation protein A [Rhizomicrobium sp.]
MRAEYRAAQWQRVALDLGPLVVFFGTFRFFGIFTATAFFMAAVLLALGVGYLRERRLSPMPLITAVLVLVFGALTLYLRNDIFIKMKPTALYALFSLLLAGGLACNQLLIRHVFAQAFELSDAGWRALTWRWAGFFLALAALNEVVWRNFTTAVWVSFKVWAIIPLIFLFALAQTPLIFRHQIKTEDQTQSGG